MTPSLPVAEAPRYGSAMLRRFGWLYHALGLGWLLGRIRLEEHSAERVRTAAEQGPVVYVLLHTSTIDYLALNTVLNQRKLPLAVWTQGIRAFWWQPVARAWRDLAERWPFRKVPDAVQTGWLGRTVASGHPVAVFLDRGRPIARLLGREQADPLPALLAAQDQCEQPVQMLPVLVVWNRAPDVERRASDWFLLGNREEPGVLTRLRNLLTRSKGAFVQVGEPLDLQRFMGRVDTHRQVRALRTVLRRYLKSESHLVRGPRLLPRKVMRRLVLDDPPMRELCRQEAEARGAPPEEIRREMERAYDAMAANFKWWVIRILSVVLRPLWTRVFSGVDARPEDLERIRAAMRGGTAILLPSHKSHFDYVLLSWVFYEHDLIPPHVVAGINLAVWPLSFFLRRCGGFFIKRSFTGERIFPAVFERYLREMLHQGYPVEFFLEGGRSRTGRLLPPRVGVLGMVMEAAELRPHDREITLLPIALAYEQVAEERAYARELEGGQKKPESMGEFLRARSVLRHRFGRCYLRVGEPIPTSTIVDAEADTQGRTWSQRSRLEQKSQLMNVGERVLYRIGQSMVLLPTALVSLALLAHHRRAIRHSDLLVRMDRFRAFLARAGALESAALARTSHAVARALDRFHRRGLVAALELDGERIWEVEVRGRITLGFYKNQVLHFFAEAGFAAAAIRGLPEGEVTTAQIRPGFLLLVWLLRSEIMLDPDRPASDSLAQGLENLCEHGALEPTEAGGWRVADAERMGEIYGLFRSLLEAYAVVLRHSESHLSQGLDTRELIRALQQDESALMAGGAITRPESLSMVSLKNAIRVYTRDGVLTEDERGHLVLDPEAAAWRLERLGPMVY